MTSPLTMAALQCSLDNYMKHIGCYFSKLFVWFRKYQSTNIVPRFVLYFWCRSTNHNLLLPSVACKSTRLSILSSPPIEVDNIYSRSRQHLFASTGAWLNDLTLYDCNNADSMHSRISGFIFNGFILYDYQRTHLIWLPLDLFSMAISGFILYQRIHLTWLPVDSSYINGFILHGYQWIHLILADSSYMVINGFILHDCQWIHLIWFYNTSPTDFRVSGFTLYDCQLRLHHTSLATLCLRSRPPIGVDIYCYQPQTHGLSRVSPRVP